MTTLQPHWMFILSVVIGAQELSYSSQEWRPLRPTSLRHPSPSSRRRWGGCFVPACQAGVTGHPPSLLCTSAPPSTVCVGSPPMAVCFPGCWPLLSLPEGHVPLVSLCGGKACLDEARIFPTSERGAGRGPETSLAEAAAEILKQFTAASFHC